MANKTGSSQPEVSVKDPFIIPYPDQRGISSGYTVNGDFNKASEYIDPRLEDLSISGMFPMSRISSGGTYQFGNGNVAAPAISWASDTDSGEYWISSGKWGISSNGVKVADWSSLGLTLNLMTAGSVLFAGTGGLVSQDNSNLFWDDSNNRLGIGCNDPWKALEVRSSSSQLVLSLDDNNAVLFQGNGLALTITGYGTLYGEPIEMSWTGAPVAQSKSISVYHTDNTSGSSHARFIAQVGGASGGDAATFYSVAFGTTWGVGLDNSDSDKFKISKNATLGTNDYLTITTTGAVGINTTTPDRPLDVLSASGYQLRLTYTDSSVYGDLDLDLDGALYVDTTGQQMYVYAHTSGAVGTLGVYHDQDTAGSGVEILCQVEGPSSGDAVIIAGVRTANYWAFGVDNSDSDKWKLSQGTALGVNDCITVTTSGSVGINTTGPDRRLDVLDASSPQLRLTYSDGATYTDLQTTSSGILYLNPTGGGCSIRNNALTSFGLGIQHSSGNCLGMTADSANQNISIYWYDNAYGTAKARLLYAGGNGAGSRYFGFLNLASDYTFFGEPNSFRVANGSGANTDVVLGAAALATSATAGFLYVPTCAGTPTGTPTTYTGVAPLVLDTTNSILYFYNSGWKGVGLA